MMAHWQAHRSWLPLVGVFDLAHGLCDAVLLSGSVIMNESMLTGESVPVTKTALLKASSEDVVYCNKAHEKSSLKCGTMVIQTRKAGQEQVTAVVIR